MPRIDTSNFTDPGDAFDLEFNDAVTTRRKSQTKPGRKRQPEPGRRLVNEGRSGRQAVEEAEVARPLHELTAAPPGSEVRYSTYDVAQRGPEPAPDWLITALSAVDTPLGTVKTGKEADVSLLERSVTGGPGCLLAVKTYRSAEHRQFHRDAGYLEGRRTRRSRETRAMAKRTGFGRDLLAGRWAAAEFANLAHLWSAGVRVPYPVQLIGSELMMEFIGAPDGTAAPRLAGTALGITDLTDLWHDLTEILEVLATAGMTHGDLSPYNVLVGSDGCVLIDLPQAVDVVANPQGMAFLERDCRTIAAFFARRGVTAADPEVLAARLAGAAGCYG